MRLAYAPYILHFREPAGTSRGILTEKPTFFIKIYDETNPEVYGLGECAVFPGLSPEADGRYGFKLMELLANIAIGRETDLSRHSSIMLGLEEAIRDFSSGGRGLYFQSPFTEGKQEITINGLVWMGTVEEMTRRAALKVEEGFKCLKFKIGAQDWTKELEMISAVRSHFPASQLEIRVDANGAFTPEEAMSRLEDLSHLDIHSCEQPIAPGNPAAMAEICRLSPVPVALDETLIGIFSQGGRRTVLDTIMPQYIILKPSLCGGFSGAEGWIEEARERGIGWWVTSALESNVGLTAIAQWAATLNSRMPQGLGTGGLFTDNFVTPLSLHADKLSYTPGGTIAREQFDALDWHS
ncbi:MAG: o-succinylbenzoate synthase [Muribaculaceae bacterium]|nr:o-succinylbenzoate synthase [Muribaculaceae bacterium]